VHTLTDPRPSLLLSLLPCPPLHRCAGSHSLGWGHSVLFDELGEQVGRLNGLEKTAAEGSGARVSVVNDMLDLRRVWPEVFVASTNGQEAP
jgi:hypothetical protein